MTTLYITPPNGKTMSVDLYGDTALSLNYAIADVREPDKRQSSFSKTITLPGTANNNKLFNHIFEIDSSGTFNPNKKASAVLYADTLPVFSGYMQLTHIVSTYKNNVEYEVNLLGNLADFFHALQQVNTATNNPLYLEDLALDGSAGNTATDCSHVKTTQNVAASWSYTSKYVYPLMDFGTLERHAITGGHYSLNSKNATPCLFAKTILDEIFYEAGTNIGLPAGTYSYKSDFLNGVNLPAGYLDFTKLIVPCINSRPRHIRVNLTIITQTNYAPITLTPYNTYVALNKIDGVTGLDTPVNFGYYTGGIGYGSNATYNISYSLKANAGDRFYVSVQGNMQSGSLFSVVYDAVDKLGLDGSFTAQLTYPFIPSYGVVQKVVFDTKVTDTNNTYNTGTGNHAVPKINLAGKLAKSVKQSEFIMGLVKLFNLYIQVDKNNP